MSSAIRAVVAIIAVIGAIALAVTVGRKSEQRLEFYKPGSRSKILVPLSRVKKRRSLRRGGGTSTERYALVAEITLPEEATN